MKTEICFDEVANRLKKALEIKYDLELAELLNIKNSTFNARKKAQSLPFEEIFSLAITRNLDFHWLLTGEGNMYRQPAAISENQTNKVMELYNALSDSQRREILSVIEEKQQFNQLIETVHELQRKAG